MNGSAIERMIGSYPAAETTIPRHPHRTLTAVNGRRCGRATDCCLMLARTPDPDDSLIPRDEVTMRLRR